MNCQNCNSESFYWRGKVLPSAGAPTAEIEIHCSFCKRMYQARIPWESFKLIDQGRKKEDQGQKRLKEEMVSLEEVQGFKKKFLKELK